MTLNDSVGRTTKLTRSQLRGPVWLSASRPSPVAQGVADRNITYSIKSAVVRGSNAVNSGQLRFDTRSFADLERAGHPPFADHRWQRPDGRTPAGSSVRLTYPDGAVRMVPFGPGPPGHLARPSPWELRREGARRPGAAGVHGAPLDETRRPPRSSSPPATGSRSWPSCIGRSRSVIMAAGVIGRRRRRAVQQADTPDATGTTGNTRARYPSRGGVGGAALA